MSIESRKYKKTKLTNQKKRTHNSGFTQWQHNCKIHICFSLLNFILVENIKSRSSPLREAGGTLAVIMKNENVKQDEIENKPHFTKDLEINLLMSFQFFFSSINETFKQNGIELELSLKSKKYDGLESNPNRVLPKVKK